MALLSLVSSLVSSLVRPLVRPLSLVLLTCVLSGCGTLSYLLQATRGQLALSWHARPIAVVLQDPKIAPRIKQLLSQVALIKAFGEAKGLKPTRNYKTYVALHREAAVWVVSACRPLQFQAKEWSFPLVGSFPYLGWFELASAKQQQAELQAQGWDADVRGAAAYSTLGWFPDSVLSTMLSAELDALGDLVNVILHESVHTTLYLPNQSFFNESIATFMADQLTLDYLKEGGLEAEWQAYRKQEADNQSRNRLFYASYQALAKLYASQQSDAKKLQQKAALLVDLKAQLHLKRTLNNATLIQFKTYHAASQNAESSSSELRWVLEHCQQSWLCFLGHLKEVAEQVTHPQPGAGLVIALPEQASDLTWVTQHASSWIALPSSP